MERNIIIENICTACRCGERRAEEYLAAELRNLRELRELRDPVRCATAILKRPVLGWDWTSIIRTISAVPCH